MALSTPPTDWLALNLSKDLKILNFEPWVVITRRTLDFNTKENEPAITMMVFLNSQTRIFVLNVLNRTWKKGQFQTHEQVASIIHEFFSGNNPCYGYTMDQRFAKNCLFLVNSREEICSACRKMRDGQEIEPMKQVEKSFHLNKDTEELEHDSEETIMEEVEDLLDSNPLCDIRPSRDILLADFSFNCREESLSEVITDHQLQGGKHEDEINPKERKTKLKKLQRSDDSNSSIPCFMHENNLKNTESQKARNRKIHKDGRSVKPKSKKLLEHLHNVSCSRCETRFAVGRDLFTHFKDVHELSDEDIQKDFHVPVCYICQQAFATNSLLQMHKKRDHLLGKWKCTVCWKDLGHGEEVQSHYEDNHQPKDFQIKCALCEKELCFRNSFEAVREHWNQCLKDKLTEYRLRNAHRYLTKKFVCDVCGMAFPNEMLLIDHQDEHQGILNHSCSQCDYKTGTIRKLRSHIKYWHSGTRGSKPPVVACEICGQQVYKTNLWKHMANRHEEKALSCNECDKKFGTTLSLRAHMETVHPKNTLTCAICNTQVKCAAKLKVHMAIHQPPKYFCRFCGKGLKTTVSLANHERLHTRENPYK